MASSGKDENKDNVAGDDDLEELLDSAIADFDKPPVEKVTNVETTEIEDVAGAQPTEPWDTEFLKEAQRQFEENMKLLIGNSDGGEMNSNDFGSQFMKLAEEANKVFTEHQMDPEFSATIAQSFKTLSEDAGNIQSQRDPEALISMLGDLNLGGSEGSNDFMPFMQNMMQSILSKDLLYPSLRDICDKYPPWLEENKDSLSSTEYENYSKQNKIMEDVCKEFEAESPSDSEETKKARFVRVLNLMEEMQKLGQPPKSLIGDNEVLLGANGLPNDPSQCSLM